MAEYMYRQNCLNSFSCFLIIAFFLSDISYIIQIFFKLYRINP